jgi:hypothetical protein
MNRYLAASAAFAFLSTVIVAASGCSAPADEDLGSAEGAATPASPSGNYALAETCSRLFKRHEVVHDLDLEVGTIRWGCGDVPGVTDPDLGQEYCEYHAVQNGKEVRKPSDIVQGGGKVSCVFTGVFTDAQSGTVPKLQAAMAQPENLGSAVAATNIVQMRGGFNSRGAATQLISDCSRSPGASTLTTRQKTAACFLAVQAGGPNAAQLTTLCKGNLNDANTWNQITALGVSVKNQGQEGYETQQDLASCMQVINAGVPWRNSDPMICSRSERAANECGCKFNAVPNQMDTFTFTGWVDDHIPSTCRLAKVDGQDYPGLAICDVPDAQLSDLALNPLYNRSLQNFCHDFAGKDLVLKLPLRALQQQGTCQTSAPFCSEYMAGQHDESSTTDGTTTEPPTTTGRTDGAPPPPVDPNGSTH